MSKTNAGPKVKRVYSSRRKKQNPGLILLILFILCGLFLAVALPKVKFSFFSNASEGNSYYVSKQGSDSNPGTLSSPFATINYGWKKLAPGDTLHIMAGTYAETVKPTILGTATLPVTITAYSGDKVIIDGQNTSERPLELVGSYITAKNLEVINSKWACAVVGGTNNTVDNIIVHNCYSHGIYTENNNANILNSTIYDTNLINKARTMSSGWGSGIKLKMGANNVTVQNNVVYNNYGEGIAATRATNSVIKNNFFYDNYGVNIYIDNSYGITVEDNLSTCTSNLEYAKLTGKKASAIGLAEEYYSGWGNQLRDIQIKNNIAAFCSHGLSYWGADSGTGGMRNVNIMNNTFYGGTHSVMSINYESGTTGTNISNNIFHSPNAVPWIQNSAGISLHDNFWIGSLPGSSTNSKGTNDVAGSIVFAGNPPTYSNANSFKVVSSTPSFTVGKYGNITFYSPTAVPVITSTPAPTTTPTPTSSPTPTTAPNVLPVIETTELPAGTVSVSYSSTLQGSDVNLTDVLSFRSTGLPKGVSINNCSQSVQNSKKVINCKLSGRPRTAGNYSPVVTLLDGKGGQVSKTFSIIVN